MAVFASDALSSTAYATQEILFILAAAGAGAFQHVFPISIVIVILLSIVTLSYEQIIHAYPDGGGAYIVSRDNLGVFSALTAAAALLTDYILTVAVSISSGVAQIVSAFPALYDYRVWIAIGMVLFIMLINLRGVKESGLTFAILSYFFITMMYLMVGLGFFQYFFGSLGKVIDPPEITHVDALLAVTPFLLLHAFSSGTTALTGIEAISNGITAFKEPRSKNAGITLIWMGVILASLFLGISFLSGQSGATPSEYETVISQLARTVFNGRNLPYLLTLSATTIILAMASNTAYAGFPRLSALVAKDGFLPRQLTYRGSRLVFSNGIVTLAVIASLLIFAFQASVNRLIPLYAIGVFLSFTLSQFGMARRWLKVSRLKPGEERIEPASVLRYDPRARLKMVINGFGGVCTTVVMFVFGITKFRDGAWLVFLLIPSLIGLFYLVHHHYASLAKRLSLENYGAPPRIARHRVIIPISGVHRGSLLALRYALALSDDVTAVHVSIDEAETKKLKEKWDTWGEGVRLVILESPYRLLLEPLLQYIEELGSQRQPNETITVVVPQFVPKRLATNLLHMQTAWILRAALLFQPGIVITDVPYQVD